MQRFKQFVATGLAPNGRLYAGDLLQMQDLAAAQADFLQTIDLAVVRIGEAGLQLLRYGTLEARLTGALRTDGIVRALGGLYVGAFTTTQRNAIPSGFRPFGVIILNTTVNRYEWNAGSDAVPNWLPLGADPAAVIPTSLADAKGDMLVASAADTWARFAVGSNGKIIRADSAQTLGVKWDDVLTLDTFANRPSAASSIGKFYFSTDRGSLEWSNGSTWTLIAASPSGQVVTTLPPSPFDGQQIIYKAAQNCYWQLIWVAAEGKWEFLGGPALQSFVPDQITQNTSNSNYIDLSGSPGPAVTAPEAGFYEVNFGAGYMESNTTNGVAYMSFQVGGTGAQDADAVIGPSRNQGDKFGTRGRIKRKTIGKNVAITAKYKTLDGGDGQNPTIVFGERWLEITPVYITP